MERMASDPISSEILIVGAGPTGLVLALWLAKLGLRPRIIDKAMEPGITSRALAVQARTLEFYEQIGLAADVVDRGHQVPAMNLWVRSRRAARVPLEEIGRGFSPFSFLLIYPQDEHERFLIQHLHELGIDVERGTELLGLEEHGIEVHAVLRKADGSAETFTTSFVAGCDGARSRVREALGIEFLGGTYDHLFYVADVEAGGPPMNGELHVDFDAADFLAIFPLKGRGRARLIGSVRDDIETNHELLQFADVRNRAIRNLKIEVKQVNWFSTYRVHHRVARTFRRGSVFLLGDAAHIHSPVGGQGMNTGIGDAVNLAWKLASALNHPETRALLDSYEPERMAFARRLVATTDRVFKGVVSSSAFSRFMRTRALPVLVPAAFRFPTVRALAFRTVSQIALEYREGPLSRGRAGGVHGGDRLPWIEHAENFAPLRSLDWQVHVHGSAKPALEALCKKRGIPLHQFRWQPSTGRTGVRRDAAYLVRPDGYVACAIRDASAADLLAYLDEKKVRVIR